MARNERANRPSSGRNNYLPAVVDDNRSNELVLHKWGYSVRVSEWLTDHGINYPLREGHTVIAATNKCLANHLRISRGQMMPINERQQVTGRRSSGGILNERLRPRNLGWTLEMIIFLAGILLLFSKCLTLSETSYNSRPNEYIRVAVVVETNKFIAS